MSSSSTIYRFLVASLLGGLVLATTATDVSASATTCHKRKLTAASLAAKKLGLCRAKFAKNGNAAAADDCRATTLEKVADKIAKANDQADKATPGFVCPGDLVTLEIDGPEEWLEATLASAVFAANAIPDKCVFKRAKEASKYASTYAKCWIRNFAGNAGDVADCASRAADKMDGAFAEGDCTTDDAASVRAAMHPEMDAQAALVTVECGDATVAGTEQCDDGNAVEGDGCDSNCTLSACGNGVTGPGEQCDDGNAVDGDGCDTNCTVTACGNGIATAGEACDDGNLADGDGCDSNCTVTGCGNGIATAGEQCDDGNASNTDACLNTCVDASCGDGFTQAGVEDCDDANASNTDACLNTCVDASCGDGFAQSGVEACDDGNGTEGDGCDSNCTVSACGNGVNAPDEECDDGGLVDDDGCDSNCTVTACGNGIATSGEACDDGNGTEGDGCDSNCTLSACGNGVNAPDEECDDGGLVDDDGCDSNCTVTACGNGIATSGEACDDGNATEGDGCDSNCTVSACGNGVTAPTEECDDGNMVDGDGCDTNCTTTGCGNGVATAGEACDDGNATPGDGCENDCTVTPLCGNGTPDPGEDCDDDNNVDGDGCSSTCKEEECGLVGGVPTCILCVDGASPDPTYSFCSCDAGYVQNGGACDDIDECALATDSCPVGDPCVNVPGSYACAIDCNETAYHAALASCGAPSGVITFDCTDTTIFITGDPNEPSGAARDIECDGLVVDGLDRNITFEQNPACFETVLNPGQCEMALNPDGTCDCPAINDGSVFMDIEGNDNVIRNLDVNYFFDGVIMAGDRNLVENVNFSRICDSAMKTQTGGVANEFRDVTASQGCDKCVEARGDIGQTSPHAVLKEHYNAIFRRTTMTDCDQPFRATMDGRYLLDRVAMIGGLPSTHLFRCLGPRATTPTAGDLVVHLRDSLVDDCIRGLRLGGFTEATVERSTFQDNDVRGVLVYADARASFEDSVFTGNGGLGTSEPGTGGISVTDSALVDLGGGSILIDGNVVSSGGGNALCGNVAPNGSDRDAQNLTGSAVKAENNWWCDLDPSDQIHENPGSIDTTPHLTESP